MGAPRAISVGADERRGSGRVRLGTSTQPDSGAGSWAAVASQDRASAPGGFPARYSGDPVELPVPRFTKPCCPDWVLHAHHGSHGADPGSGDASPVQERRGPPSVPAAESNRSPARRARDDEADVASRLTSEVRAWRESRAQVPSISEPPEAVAWALRAAWVTALSTARAGVEHIAEQAHIGPE